jgi:tyrosine-specific transport protein
MTSKLIGSILLIVGTSIGAGMLALPVATAQLGFMGSLLLLCACWFVMTAGAFFILEVNLWLPSNSNLISMARATLGPFGQVLAWLSYFLLLYSLLCAYISGGSEIFENLLSLSGVHMPRWLASLSFTVLFGIIVYLGIRVTDYVNRGLMFFKLGSYFLLVILLVPFVSLTKLTTGDLTYLTSSTAVLVTITSFGYAAIVPSLRIYFAGDVKKLRLAIVIGSLIPLVCYILWDMVIMGLIPLDGANGLIAIFHSKDSTSDLINTLSATAESGQASDLCIKLFTSISVVTSFLGVALCLVDFLADGLRVEKEGAPKFWLHAMTFVPPVLIVLFFPNIFVQALKYAGIYCVVLLILLPAWMVWNGRYRRGLAKGYRAPGGRLLVGAVILLALALMVLPVVN